MSSAHQCPPRMDSPQHALGLYARGISRQVVARVRAPVLPANTSVRIPQIARPIRREAQHRSHSHHPCRQPDPARTRIRIHLRAKQKGEPVRRTPPMTACLDRDGRRGGAPAGRGRRRRRQRRRVRQGRSAGRNTCSSACPASSGGRSRRTAIRSPRGADRDALRRVLRRARCQRERVATDDAIRSCVGADQLHRAGASCSATSTTSRRR